MIFEGFNAKKQQILDQSLGPFSEKIKARLLSSRMDCLRNLAKSRTSAMRLANKITLEDVEQMDGGRPHLVLALKEEFKSKLGENVQDATAMMDQKNAESRLR